jgi:uncharacterized membrane protein
MKKTILILIIIVSIYFLIDYTILGSTPYPIMMHHYPYYAQNGIDWLWSIAVITISGIALLISTFMLLPKRYDNLSILDERLAKGEVSIEEYKKLRKVIKS